jgi:hypothetical protein
MKFGSEGMPKSLLQLFIDVHVRVGGFNRSFIAFARHSPEIVIAARRPRRLIRPRSTGGISCRVFAIYLAALTLGGSPSSLTTSTPGQRGCLGF